MFRITSPSFCTKLNWRTIKRVLTYRIRFFYQITHVNKDSISKYKKSKGLPRQAKVAYGVPGRLWPRIFLTFRHYKGGSSSAKRTGRVYPRRNRWYSLSEAESTSEHIVLSGVPRKKSPVTPPEIDPGTFWLVVQCLRHFATPDPFPFPSIFQLNKFGLSPWCYVLFLSFDRVGRCAI